MTDRVRINTGNLNRTKEQVASRIRQVRGQITAMHSDINALNTMWAGEAHSAFDSEIQKDIRRLENLCRSLDRIVSYEDHAITVYERCEREVALRIDDVRV